MTKPRDEISAPQALDQPLLEPPPSRPAIAGPSATAVPPPRQRHWLRWLIALLILLAVIWLISRLWPSKPAVTTSAAVPVGAATIGTGKMRDVLQGLGTVTPFATITVETQISGMLMSVGFKEGQIVQKGDFLAQIDPRPYQAALEEAQGTLAKDQGLLAQAKSDLARYLQEDRQNSIAKQTVTDQEYLVQQDQGQVLNDKGAVDTAKLNLAYCHITAPVTGRLGLRLVDPGNYVQSTSSTGLVVETQLQPISVIFVLPEDDIPDLSAQFEGGPPLPVEAYGRDDNKKIADGTLEAVDNTVDTTTGTVKLRATFANQNLALFPNEFVNARLVLKTLQNVIEVPVQAVQYGAPGTFVYLIKPNNTVAVQVITTGITYGDNMQVLSGLKIGDKVVIDGADLLRDGSKVRIEPESNVKAAMVNNGPGASPGEQPQNAQPQNAQPNAGSNPGVSSSTNSGTNSGASTGAASTSGASTGS